MMTRPIATLSDCRSPVSAVHQVTFDKLAERFGKCDVGTKEGKAWMPADIEVGPRTAERVNSVSLLVLDVEADAEAVKGESGDPLRDKHGDIVKRIIGPEPPAVDDMLAELPLHGWHCILHTSYSHSAEHPRYRLIFDLSRPLAPAEIKFFGLHVAGLIGIGDCFDSACLEPARLFYLPRCPAERLPLFRHGVTEGDPLPVDDLLTEARKIEAAQKSALTRRHGGQSGNVIQAFNDQADIRLMLEQHGYVPKGRRRWLRAGSTTGLPGVRLLPDDGKGERVYSNHGGELPESFKAWEIARKNWHGLSAVESVKKACRLLFEYGWLIELDAGGATGGRPADPVYAVSPKAGVTA